MKSYNAPIPISATTRTLGRSLLVPLVLLIALATSTTALAQVSCGEALTEARRLFQTEGEFEQASELLERCDEQMAFPEEERPQVYTLLAKIYEASNKKDQAKAVLKRLLNLVPNYEPEEDDPPTYKELVEIAKQEMEEKIPPPPVVEVTLASEQGEGISNVQLRQDEDRWIVSYDLIGEAKKYQVSLLLSRDGGDSFEAMPQAVRGDVGKGIRPGADKRITWAALADFPQGLVGDQYRVQVVAQKQGGKGLLYVLGGVLVAGAGTTAVLAFGGGGNGNGTQPLPPIPTPPDRPPGN